MHKRLIRGDFKRNKGLCENFTISVISSWSQQKMLSDAYVRKMMHAFVETYGLVSHHMESYENYIQYQIPEIVAENSPIRVPCTKQNELHLIHMSDVYISKPVVTESDGFVRTLSPKEAFMRSQTYCGDVFVNLRHDVYKAVTPGGKVYMLQESKIFNNVLMFKVPAMCQSSLCNDKQNLRSIRQAGTLIVNGYEKTMISQEKLKTNYPYCFVIKRATKYAFRVEVRSHHPQKIRSTSTLNVYMTGNKTNTIPSLCVAIPFIKTNVPLFVCFRILGVTDPSEMLQYIVGFRSRCSKELSYLAKSIICNDDSDTADLDLNGLFDWVGERCSTEKVKRKRIMYVKHVFINEFLPHCVGGNVDKAFFLGYTVRRLISLYLGEIPADDIDSYKNKRVATSGSLLALLTGKYINMTDFFSHRKISSGLKYACATGNWGISKGASNQSGVCQVLCTMNKIARLSHMRQINTPINRDGNTKYTQHANIHTHHANTPYPSRQSTHS
jgi:DNA-directed RNA polymerase II subunit RPB2